MTNQDTYMVYIPASGHGSRIRELAGNKPKTLLQVGEQTILARLLSAASALPDTHVVISVRPEDISIEGYLRSHGFSCSIEIKKMAPGGYLADLVRVSKEAGYNEFTVLNSDLVAPLPDLLRFLSGVRQWNQEVPLVMGVTESVSDRYNAEDIWLTPQSNFSFMINPPGMQGSLMVANAHHWRPSGLQEAEYLLSQRPTRFHDYIARLAQQNRLVGGIPFSQAHNVNTADLLARARAEVLAWQRSGKDAFHIRNQPDPEQG